MVDENVCQSQQLRKQNTRNDFVLFLPGNIQGGTTYFCSGLLKTVCAPYTHTHDEVDMMMIVIICCFVYELTTSHFFCCYGITKKNREEFLFLVFAGSSSLALFLLLQKTFLVWKHLHTYEEIVSSLFEKWSHTHVTRVSKSKHMLNASTSVVKTEKTHKTKSCLVKKMFQI